MTIISDWWFWPTNASGPGVYLLIEGGSVVYVGKTNNFHRRLIEHHVINYRWIKKILKDKARLIFWPCEEPEMSIREAYLIFCLQPILNTTKPNAIKLVPEDFFESGEEMLEELRRLL